MRAPAQVLPKVSRSRGIDPIGVGAVLLAALGFGTLATLTKLAYAEGISAPALILWRFGLSTLLSSSRFPSSGGAGDPLRNAALDTTTRVSCGVCRRMFHREHDLVFGGVTACFRLYRGYSFLRFPHYGRRASTGWLARGAVHPPADRHGRRAQWHRNHARLALGWHGPLRCDPHHLVSRLLCWIYRVRAPRILGYLAGCGNRWHLFSDHDFRAPLCVVQQ